MEYAIGWIAVAAFTGVVASSKGRSGFGWFLLGFLFSIFALIAVAAMPSLKLAENAPSPETHVRCPECREFVYIDASKCKHCGTSLVPQTPDPSRAEMVGRELGAIFRAKKSRK